MNERPRAHYFQCALAVCVALASASPGHAQPAARRSGAPPAKTAFNAATYDSLMLSEFAWRPIGPALTSGRISDLAVAEGPESRVGDRLDRKSTRLNSSH